MVSFDEMELGARDVQLRATQIYYSRSLDSKEIAMQYLNHAEARPPNPWVIHYPFPYLCIAVAMEGEEIRSLV